MTHERASVPAAWRAIALACALAALSSAAPGLASAAERPWMSLALTPDQRAESVLSQMTLTEKLAMLHGGKSCGYVGCVDANSRLGIPALRLQDGPVGVGDGLSGVTVLPAPVSGAATWDTALMRKYGEVLGSEQWGKGVNVALAPTVNIVRDPRWGRAFESFGEDPFLAGRIAVADIQGIQSQGPMAQVKHYVAYNQETNRFDNADNAIISDRALHEIYLPAFEAAVQDGQADSAMCSYNRINDIHACENGPTQNGLLKGELGFTGFITADWGATHSTVASAKGGLDLEMPDARYFGAPLTTAVANGEVPTAVIDDKVRRILRSMFRRGLFDKTQTGRSDAIVATPANAAVARQVALQGSVLLKNANNLLPLAASTRSIAVIGAGAGASVFSQGGGSAGVVSTYVIDPYQGLKARAGTAATVSFDPGLARNDGALPAIDPRYLKTPSGNASGYSADFYAGTALAAPVVASRTDGVLDFDWHGGSPAQGLPGSNWSGRWNTVLTPPVSGTYTLSLTSDDGSRLFVDGQQVIDAWVPQASTTRTAKVNLTAGRAVKLQVDYFQEGGGSNLTLGWLLPGQNLHDQAIASARAAEVAVVVVGKFEAEGSDIGEIALSKEQDQLVRDVVAVNPRTVVVVNSGSAVELPWVNQVPAVIEAWYPGQEYGHALAALLYGDENFSGKLPVSFPKSLADVPAHTAAQFPGTNGTVQYSEGVLVGYRWYDRQGIEPLYPFGHGLSYTSFAYSNLAISAADAEGTRTVAFDLTNTGARAGAEVAQVYVGQPAATGEPPRNLRGFQRVALNPGQTRRVSIPLNQRSFRYWTAGWLPAVGVNQVFVGSSSRDFRLTGSVNINPPAVLPRKGWTATASSSYAGDVPANLLDGKTGTRWTTGLPMAAGQSLTLDLHTTARFSRVVMDSGASLTDYAAGYQVYTSTDGTNWGAPAYTGLGSGPVLTATFAPRDARYVKIVQTGSSTSWWSIAELNLSL